MNACCKTALYGAVLLAAGTCRADVTWTATAGGDLDDKANWGGTLPGTSDTTLFTTVQTGPLTLSEQTSAQTFNVMKFSAPGTNMFSTILAVFLIDRIGRKGLIYIGVSIMIVCLVAIGFMFLWHVKGPAFVSAFLVYIFAQAISISAVVFVLLSEMYPNRVRGVAMSVAGFALWVGTYLVGQFTPWCMQTLGSSGTFFFFAAMCLPYLAIMRFLVPDTTGKSLEDIEAHWAAR